MRWQAERWQTEPISRGKIIKRLPTMEEAENYAWGHSPELLPNERPTNGSATQPLVKPPNQ